MPRETVETLARLMMERGRQLYRQEVQGNDTHTNALRQSIYPRGAYSLIEGAQPMHTMKKNSFQQIRLTEDEYKGHPFLDVRIYVKGEGGKYYPTRQGLAVPRERVDAFADLVEQCRQTLETTRK